jgi:hypothetical protein
MGLETFSLHEEEQGGKSFKNLEFEDFESPIVGNLVTLRNFDEKASSLERGITTNFLEKGIMGHPILSGKTQKELAESYKRKNEIASLHQEDMYDFWLLQRTYELLRDRGELEASTPPETVTRYIDHTRYLGIRYAEALSQAIVRESLIYEKNTMHEFGIDTRLSEGYEKIILGEEDAPSIVDLALLVAQRKETRNDASLGNTKRNGWDKSSEELIKLVGYLREDPQSPSQRLRNSRYVAVSIDSLNGFFHNSAGMTSHMVDQSQTDRDFLAVCESFIQEGNTALIYKQASPAAKNLFKEAGGNAIMIEEAPDLIDRGPNSPEYQEALTKVLRVLLSTGHSPQEAWVDPNIYFKELSQELSEMWGGKPAKKFLVGILEKPEIAKAIKDGYANDAKSRYSQLGDVDGYSEEHYELVIEATERKIEEYEHLEKVRIITGLIPGFKAVLAYKKRAQANNN